MLQKCSEGSCRKRPISAETVRKYVAENRLTEREGLLLRGSAATRGFAGCLDHSLDWLERFSPWGDLADWSFTGEARSRRRHLRNCADAHH